MAFAANARSLEVYRRVLAGERRLSTRPGRGAGRIRAALAAAAGFTIAAADRIFSRKLAVPLATRTVHDVAIESFAFPELEPDALHDFLSDAFVFTLTPAGTAA